MFFHARFSISVLLSLYERLYDHGDTTPPRMRYHERANAPAHVLCNSTVYLPPFARVY